MPGVQDRVIVVTGAGGGLGREYALTLAKEGASVLEQWVGPLEFHRTGGDNDEYGRVDSFLRVSTQAH